jgi:hypothetical protein
MTLKKFFVKRSYADGRIICGWAEFFSENEFFRAFKTWNKGDIYATKFEFIPERCVKKIFPNVDWNKNCQLPWPK